MYADQIDNEYRREIFLKLCKAKSIKYSKLKADGMESNKFAYHLKKLKEAGLISESKYKNFIYYELDTSQFEELLHWIEPSCETLKELEESK